MNLYIKKGYAKGCVTAPPSKSVAHRYLFCSLLSEGENNIKNIAYSDDINATLSALKCLGCSIIEDKYNVKVFGLGNNDYDNSQIIDCNESGSTIRFIIPILLTCDKEFRITGKDKLLSRPLTEYENLCKKYGFEFRRENNIIYLRGKLQSGEYSISSEVSSQFATGMLLALSRFKEESIIHFTGQINSRPYIDMTIQTLCEFGKKCEWISDNTIYIYPGRIKCMDMFIEGDESNCAFLDAFNYIGGDVCINGKNINTIQGDRVYKEYFELLNKENCILDIENCPDLAPILMVLASVKYGCVLTNTYRLKVKESDRGECMKQELSKFGIRVDNLDNSIIVHKCDISSPKEAINPHNDHRIAMALSVLLTMLGGTVYKSECVNKSYPDFFDVLKSLNIEIEEI